MRFHRLQTFTNSGQKRMAKGKFISYLRVSTDKQGRSGLGLEAQREAVTRYLNGGNWTVVASTSRPKAASGATGQTGNR
jgi:DNA invertase Pin-like site-specific DNA recombinase